MTFNKLKQPIFATATVILFAINTLPAQDNAEILKIRAIYNEINSSIVNCQKQVEEPCGLYLNTLEINKGNEPWAAVGIYHSNQDFWYTSSDEEANTYKLRKINMKTERSARMEQEEYLFDEAGTLIFYFFQLSGGGKNLQTYRFYFNEEKLIDYKEKLEEEELNFRVFAQEEEAAVLEKANALKQLFLLSVE